MKKKIVSLALVASLLALVIVGGTLAYFTDDEAVTNTFTVGNVNIKLEEPAWALNDNYDDVNDKLLNIQPGIPYDKDPTVTNIGANNAYVRVDVTFTDVAALAAAGVDDPRDLLATVDTSVWTPIDTPVATGTDTVTYGYYYKAVLEPTIATGALFTTMTIPAEFDNADMQTLRPDFTITVTAHAIQADTFTSVEDAFDAYIQQDGDAYLAPTP